MRSSDWSSDVCASDLAACGCSGASVIDRTGVTHAAVPPKTRSQCARVSVANRSANSALRTGQLALSARSGSSVPVMPNPSSSRSDAHTSELQSLMRTSYAVFCLDKKRHSNLTLHIIRYHHDYTASFLNDQ